MDDFVPKGAPKSKGEGHAMTLAAGVQLPGCIASSRNGTRSVCSSRARVLAVKIGMMRVGVGWFEILTHWATKCSGMELLC